MRIVCDFYPEVFQFLSIWRCVYATKPNHFIPPRHHINQHRSFPLSLSINYLDKKKKQILLLNFPVNIKFKRFESTGQYCLNFLQ